MPQNIENEHELHPVWDEAFAFYEQRKFEEAGALFTHLFDERKTAPYRILECWANCYTQLGDIDKAKTIYLKAVVLHPDNPKAHLGLLRILRAMGLSTQSLISKLEQLHQRFPNFGPIYTMLGNQYIVAGRFQKANSFYKKYPVQPIASQGLAQIRILKKQYKQALNICEDALKEYPTHIGILRAKNTCILKLKGAEESYQLFLKLWQDGLPIEEAKLILYDSLPSVRHLITNTLYKLPRKKRNRTEGLIFQYELLFFLGEWEQAKQLYNQHSTLIQSEVAIIHAAIERSFIETNGVKITLQSNWFTPLLWGAIKNNQYENTELSILQKTCSPDDIVLEAGGGIGFLACFIAKKMGASVITVEANPMMAPIIETNKALNGVDFELITGLIGTQDRNTSFFVNQHMWASSILQQSESDQKIEVHEHDINALLQRTSATYLALDVEGGETAIIPHLIGPTLKKLMMEVHPQVIGISKTRKLHKALTSKGFKKNPSISKGNVWYFER